MFLIKWTTLVCMHVCECPHQCDTSGNISAVYWKLEGSNVLVMMFAFPLVPWPLLAQCFTITTRGLGPGTWKEMHRSLCHEVKIIMTRALISINLEQGILSFKTKSKNRKVTIMFMFNRLFSLQVVLCKFHSVFLSQKGQVFTCGHGQGGRLGHGDEQTYLVRVVLGRYLGPTMILR